MSIPGFKAEASLSQSKTYYVVSNINQAAGAIQPAFLGSCYTICQGDPDCIQCCLCVRRGGHPWNCCF